MSGLKGAKALALAQQVARLLEPHCPPDFTGLGIKAIPGGGVAVWPIKPSDDAASVASPVRRTTEDGMTTGIEVVGSSSIFGFGTWIPLLPRSVRARLTAQSVTETVLEQIEAATGRPWPAADVVVRTAISDGQVHVSLVAAARPAPLIMFDLSVDDCV